MARRRSAWINSKLSQAIVVSNDERFGIKTGDKVEREREIKENKASSHFRVNYHILATLKITSTIFRYILK